MIHAADVFRETYIHAALILALGFSLVMALNPRLGLNPHAVWTVWLVLTLGAAIYALWLLLHRQHVPTWLLGFALGWLFSTLIPDKPRKPR